jgi:hypothetical protein
MPGRNELELRTGDDHGLASRVVEVQSQAHRPDHLLRVLTAPPADYDTSRKVSRIRGTATARVAAPPGAKIAWLGVDASFQTHQGAEASKTQNAIAYATGPNGPFTEVFRADMPSDVNHWHTHAFREIRLPEPAGEAFVRFHGDPGLNAFTIYSHCVEDAPVRRPAMTVTHAWREGGKSQSRTIRLAESAKYVVDVPADAASFENESIELAVPSTDAR